MSKEGKTLIKLSHLWAVILRFLSTKSEGQLKKDCNQAMLYYTGVWCIAIECIGTIVGQVVWGLFG